MKPQRNSFQRGFDLLGGDVLKSGVQVDRGDLLANVCRIVSI
jgi:hypothetical protein